MNDKNKETKTTKPEEKYEIYGTEIGKLVGEKQIAYYENLGTSIGKLVKEKQDAYGSSFHKAGDCLRQMFPNGVSTEKYDELMAITRILDKLFRIAHDPLAFGENPWHDIIGYAMLGAELFDGNSNKEHSYEQPKDSVQQMSKEKTA